MKFQKDNFKKGFASISNSDSKFNTKSNSKDSTFKKRKSESSKFSSDSKNPIYENKSRSAESRSRSGDSRRKSAPKRFEEKQETEIRLNKYIADSGISSRRRADELISEGAVRVNGKIVTELGTKIPFDANVTIHGDPVSNRKKFVYILLNKPKDVITTTSDEKDRKTVMDIIRTHTRVYPVGRLDRNSTGVLLLTNDGELSYRLTHPKFEIKKIYNVYLDRPLEHTIAKQIAQGVELDDGTTSPCEIFMDPKDSQKITMILGEGRNREIRRIFELFDYNVKRLDRKYFANLSASGMQRGDYRHLSFKEIRELKKLVGL